MTPAELTIWGREAREAAHVLAQTDAQTRTAAITAIAAATRARSAAILTANATDQKRARAAGMAPAQLDRLALDEARLAGIAAGLDAIAEQPDPLGVEMERWTRPNGLDIARVRTPIGVLAVVYESRPNVGVEAAALALRSGNALILRGGSDALGSALALQEAVDRGVATTGLPPGCVRTIPTADRAMVGALLGGLEGTIDLLIPRGGRSLVERVQQEARVPVLGHLEGINHTFVHTSADLDKAVAVLLDAKLRRTSVCGATETVLIDRAAPHLLPPIARALMARGCELRGDKAAGALVPGIVSASAADWDTEHLAPILNVALVDGLDGAVAHISAHGTGHTEAILAENKAVCEEFAARVDAAIVITNASTQFADGGEFGFGAEIGIATGRLHARGPVGAEQLTSFRYLVRGSGQVRG